MNIELNDLMDNCIFSFFDDYSQELWIDSQTIAAEWGSSHYVFPWHYLFVWLKKEWSAIHIDPDVFYKFISESISAGPPHSKGESLKPDPVLSEIFTLSIADSFRFAQKVEDIRAGWIIPNVLIQSLPVRKCFSQMDLNIKNSMIDILEFFGYPFPLIKGHYFHRLGPNAAK